MTNPPIPDDASGNDRAAFKAWQKDAESRFEATAFHAFKAGAAWFALNPPAAQPAILGGRVEALKIFGLVFCREQTDLLDEFIDCANAKGLLTAPVVKPAHVTADDLRWINSAAECLQIWVDEKDGNVKTGLLPSRTFAVIDELKRILAELKARMDGGA